MSGVPESSPSSGLDLARQAAAADILGAATTRFRRSMTSYYLGREVSSLGKKLYDHVRGRIAYSVAVEGADDVYPDIHEWVLGLMPPERRRALIARTSRGGHGDELVVAGTSPEGDKVWEFDKKEPTARVNLLYDGSRDQTVVIDGHRISVGVTKPDLRDVTSLDRQGDPLPWLARRERIVFTAYTQAGRDAVTAAIQRIADARFSSVRRPELWIADSWGGFDRRRDMPPRLIDTVVLRQGQKERLIEDLERFYAAEADYVRLGIPFRRGYLFHGPPGTGKTSIAKALANRFNLDIYYIPLGDLKEDVSLLRLVSQAKAGSLLLLEDIDTFHAAVSRDETAFGVGMSGLLNALDGVSTPHGLVAVMTTNDLAQLDPALVRPGRVDLLEEIGYLDSPQLCQLVDMLANVSFSTDVDVAALEIAPAEVIEILKRNLGRPLTAVNDIEAFLRARTAGATVGLAGHPGCLTRDQQAD